MDCDDSTEQLNIVKDVSDALPVKDAENVKVLSAPGNTTDIDNESVICEPPIDKTIPEIIIGTSSEESSSSRQAKPKKSRGNGTHRKLVMPEEESTLLEYRVRKLRTLVDKCRKKKIVFPEHIISLSIQFSENPETLSLAQIESLCSECIEALDTDEESGSSSEDSTLKPSSKKKPRMGLLAASKLHLDPTNPYNQAWQSTEHFHFATQGHHRMVQPHYHVNPGVHQREPFRFGAPLPPVSNFQQPYYQHEQSCNDVFNWDVNFTGNSSISVHQGASRHNPSNIGGAS